jgi:hypothetical protein
MFVWEGQKLHKKQSFDKYLIKKIKIAYIQSFAKDENFEENE